MSDPLHSSATSKDPIIPPPKVTTEDFKAIVKLHKKSLARSVLSQLGESVLMKYYKMAHYSQKEFLCLTRDENAQIESDFHFGQNERF